MIKGEGSQARQRVSGIKFSSVLDNVFHLPQVPSDGPRRTTPECIQGGSSNQAVEHFTVYIPLYQRAISNVITLAGGALKGGANMIARACFTKPNFILYLRQGSPVEITRDCRLETIKRMRCKAISTPGPITPLGGSAVVPIIGANNPRLECDTFGTFATGNGQLPPPLL
jgi:hypothetical protein